MKKTLLSLLMFLALPLMAQVSNPSIIPVASAPSGACSVNLPDQQVVYLGTVYTCQSGTWAQLSGGGSSLPTATAQYQVPLASGAGTTYTAGFVPFSAFANPTGNLSLTMGSYSSAFNNAPLFTGTQNNQDFVLQDGTINIANEFYNFQSAYQAGTFKFTDQFDVGVDVPAAATGVYNAAATAFYMTCGSTTIDCEPIYTQVRRTAANAPIWGGNFNVWDGGFGGSGAGANAFGVEIDPLIQNTSTTGEDLRLWNNIIPGAVYQGIHFTGTPGYNTLTNGILFDQATATTAINIGSVSGGTSASMPIVFNSDGFTGTLSYLYGVGITFTSNFNNSGGLFTELMPSLPGGDFIYQCMGVNSAAANNCVNTLFYYTGSGSTSNHYGLEFGYGSEPNWTIWPNYSTEFGETTPAAGPANGIAVGTTGQFQVSGAGAVTAPSFATSGGRKGTFVCTNGGSIVVSNANYITTSDVVITMNTPGGTITTPPAFKTTSTGVSFTMLCGATDTSTYNYDILN